MKKAKTNGITLAYTRRGKGPTLVLLHGYPLDHSIWEPVVPYLENDFDLILPDLRGFGQSSALAFDYSIDDMAADVAGLLSHLDIPNAYIGGHSMGGYVALAFARQFSTRTLGLALVASQTLADAPDRRDGRYATARQIAEQGLGFVADSMTVKLTADATLQPGIARLIMEQRPQGLIGALKAMAERPDSSQVLAAFPGKIILIHSTGDALIPVERAREAKAAKASAYLVEFETGGHLPMMENPVETAVALKKFGHAQT